MSSVLPVPTDPHGLAGPHRRPAPSFVSRPQDQAAHRADIDGLRGIAVLSVLAVHSFPQWLKGGFIGVDIFFVLSGYLISGIVWRSLDAGRFNLLDFYARRVRRIFPALCLVLVACLAFSVAYTFPSESRLLGKHVAAGALFVSNIALWKEAGYFDVASEAKPLLHLWSLGIEEQFYVFWPLAMVWMFSRRRWVAHLIGGAMALSFALNIAFVADKPTATFFLPPTRVWELMMGALLAVSTVDGRAGPAAWWHKRLPAGSRWHRSTGDGLSVAGLLLLIAALALIDRTDQFPGWWALLPTAGTVALLAAGPQAWVNRHLLSQPILRFYGAISYPLYLWHWPLLSFPVVIGLPLSSEMRVGILIASVVLATLTVEFVEKPIRAASAPGAASPPFGRTPRMLCLALAVIGGGGWLLQRTDGLLDTYPPAVQPIASAEFRFDYAEYRVDRCMLRLEQAPPFAQECVDRRDSGRELVFLWGDSHAAALYPGMSTLTTRDGLGLRLAQYTAARCPPLMTPPSTASRHCSQINAVVIDRIAAERPTTVVLAGYWSLYGTSPGEIETHLTALRETVTRLQAMGVRRVVVFGHLPTWTMPQPRMLLQQWSRTKVVPERSHAHLDPRSLNMDRVLERSLAGSGAVFVSPIDRLCRPTGCLVSMEVGGLMHPVAYDESHLTAEASSVLMQASRWALPP